MKGTSRISFHNSRREDTEHRSLSSSRAGPTGTAFGRWTGFLVVGALVLALIAGVMGSTPTAVQASASRAAQHDPPTYRWNLVDHNIPTKVTAGRLYPLRIILQNTSAVAWKQSGNYRLGYRWCPAEGLCTASWVAVPIRPAPKLERSAELDVTPAQAGEGTPTPEAGVRVTSDEIPICDWSNPPYGNWPINPDELANPEFNVRAPQTPGLYAIEFDMQGPPGWFRNQSPPWPTQSVSVEVFATADVITITTDTGWFEQLPGGTQQPAVIPDHGPYPGSQSDIKEAQFIWGEDYDSSYTSTLLTKEFTLPQGSFEGYAVFIADDGVNISLNTNDSPIGNYDACFWPLPSLYPVQGLQGGQNVIRAYAYNRPDWAWFEARIEIYATPASCQEDA